MGGVVLAAGVTTKTTLNSLSAGTGTLTIMSGKVLSTTNMALAVTVNDLDIQGQGVINVSNATLSINSKYEGRTFGLGDISKDLNIDDDEFGQMISYQGLTIGSTISGSIAISGLTDSSTDRVGQITLKASKENRLVTFEEEPSSFNKGLTIIASSGIRFFESVTTKGTELRLDAGTGTLTVASLKTLLTTDRKVTLTADDLQLPGDLIAGTESISIGCTTGGRVMGVGLKKKFSISRSELGSITSNGLYIGGEVCGEFWVQGISHSNSNGISGIVTLAATRDDAWILFRGPNPNPTTLTPTLT